MLTASEDTTVCQWDIKGFTASKDLSPVRTYRGHTAWVEDVAWSELLEPLFASVGDDKRLMMYFRFLTLDGTLVNQIPTRLHILLKRIVQKLIVFPLTQRMSIFSQQALQTRFQIFTNIRR